MSILRTLNSVYEVDEAGHRIRRVSGVNKPTRNFTPDGEWKPYLGIFTWMSDARLIVFGADNYTITSKVVSEE